LNTTFLPSVPQQFIDVDREQGHKQGVRSAMFTKTIQAFMGGLFINYFNRFGRQWQSTSSRRRLPNQGRECRQFFGTEQQERDGAAFRVYPSSDLNLRASATRNDLHPARRRAINGSAAVN